MKKIIFILLAFIVLATQAFASSGDGLKRAFDEFSYSINVEWDQKDKVFYDNQVEILNSKVKALQAEGLTNSELLEFVLEQTKNDSLRKDLSLAFTQIQINKMSQSEALKLVNETMSKSYSQGASWNGSTTDKIIIGLVGVLLIAFTVAYINCLRDPNHVTVCSDDYVCSSSYSSYGSSSGCYYETSCGCSH